MSLNTELQREIKLTYDKNILKHELMNYFKCTNRTNSEYLFNMNDNYYKKLILEISDENINNISIQLIFCESDYHNDLWNYFKLYYYNYYESYEGIYLIKILLYDCNSNKYVGILQLSHDMISLQNRDKYIGWTSERKRQLYNGVQLYKHIFNVSYYKIFYKNIILYDILYNILFSKELYDYVYSKYNFYIAGYTLLNPLKKIINESNFINIGTLNNNIEIDNNIYNDILIFMDTYFKNIIELCKNNTHQIVSFILNYLQINNIYNYKNIKHYIYVVYNNDSLLFLQNKQDTFNINYTTINNNYKYNYKEYYIISKKIINNNNISFEINDIIDKVKIFRENRQNIKLLFDENKNEYITELQTTKNKYPYLSYEYLGGFFDGDGSLYIDKTTNSIAVNFSQSVLNILLTIQYQYGGIIYKYDRQYENIRIEYMLRITGKTCNNILIDLQKGSILKQHCISEALKYLQYINKRISQQKQQLITILQNINSYKTDLYDYTKLSWRYIAGMFDSEGCISLNYKKLQIHKLHICISICQCYVPNFLISIQQFIKHELNIDSYINIHKDMFISCVHKETIFKIYDNIKQYLIVKQYQFSLMHDIYNIYCGNNVDYNLISLLANEISNNKHNDVNYDININTHNITSALNSSLVSYNNNIETKAQENKILSNHLSQMKKGINNPNYGKKQTTERKIKTSITMKQLTAPLPNNIIREIKALKNTLYNGKKITQPNVIEMYKDKYNINRNLVSNVWNNKIIPLDDENIEEKLTQIKHNNIDVKNQHKGLTHGQITSLGKRTVLFEQVIDIMLYKNQKLHNNHIPKAQQIAEELSKKYNNNITLNIVKNTYTTQKIFDFEFNDIATKITYEQYMDLINDIKIPIYVNNIDII